MLSYEQILELVDKLVETPLSEISISQGEFSLSLKKENQQDKSSLTTSVIGAPMPTYGFPGPIPPPPPSSTEQPTPLKVDSGLIEVTSPMVGTFYIAPSPEASPFVEVGKTVKNGDVLCIIEAMKMMNELPSEISGTVEEICVKNSQTVEFGQLLFKIKPD
ncbi:MAG: acetyl-CoA carboxylase biotin carboxyl carrier protein [Candidatus Caenarcaniphilales bacterium]|nr:acetyl-CoA carboxylase biotin carboxyl carrier protein [Candidatus Caenarcaniphilales bacterium]